jgi:hypothetical protein
MSKYIKYIFSLALFGISYWMIEQGMIFWAIVNMIWANNITESFKR